MPLGRDGELARRAPRARNAKGDGRHRIGRQRAHQQHPSNRDVLTAPVSIARDNGDSATALLYAQELARLNPADTRLRTLLRELEKSQAH
jgi:Flp pilus assembly protein TadD